MLNAVIRLALQYRPLVVAVSLAEFVTKVHAICMHCGELATFSHRTHASKELVLLGETDVYIPLCRTCFVAARADQERTDPVGMR